GLYLAATVLAGCLARLAGARRAVALFDRITPLLVRHAIVGIIGITASTSAASATEATDPPVTLHRLPDDASTTTTTSAVVQRQVEQRVGAAAATPTPATWVVRPGDHFWGIAEHVVATAIGRAAEPRAVVGYWHRLVEANRA